MLKSPQQMTQELKLPTPCSLMPHLGQAEEHHRDRGPVRLSLRHHRMAMS